MSETIEDNCKLNRGLPAVSVGKVPGDSGFTARLSDGDANSLYVRWGGKRAFDVIVSATILLVIAPLLLVIFVATALQDGFPIFFKHRRIGRNGQSFGCIKFRSMVRDSDAQLTRLFETCPASRIEWRDTQKLRRDPRVHAVGNLLRKSSLDELPQLFNVLRGEMSLVGPRPIVVAEVDRYGAKFHHYTAVRPGITGLWQVSGRSDVGYDKRVALDCTYVRSIGFVSDMRILAKTGWVVLIGRGSC